LVLSRHATAFAKAARTVLKDDVVASFAKPPAEEKLDAADGGGDEKKANAIAKQLQAVVLKGAPANDVAAETALVAKRVLSHSKQEFKRLGIKLVDQEPDLDKLMSGWADDCVARVAKVDEDQLDKLAKILREGFGHRAETLAKDIANQLDDVSQSRADFIARDSVLTLNAQVTKHRQVACGIEKFAWTTSGDERVRESHEDIDGEVFAWDDPPIVDGETALPGEPYLCRCTPFPILPELDDDDSEDEDETDDEPAAIDDGDDADSADDEDEKMDHVESPETLDARALALEALLREHARVAIVGGPKTGKTTLATKYVTDRPLISTDKFMGLAEWDKIPGCVINECERQARFVVEGVQVARALRAGLVVDAVLYLDDAKAERLKGQASMAKAVDTIFSEWRDKNRTTPVISPDRA
jgi:SPP1 gp7 family putative phage head morphogenesis protein